MTWTSGPEKRKDFRLEEDRGRRVGGVSTCLDCATAHGLQGSEACGQKGGAAWESGGADAVEGGPIMLPEPL